MKIKTLIINVEMNEPVDQNLLIDYLAEHIIPGIQTHDWHYGDMCVSTDPEAEDELAGQWDMNWSPDGPAPGDPKSVAYGFVQTKI